MPSMIQFGIGHTLLVFFASERHYRDGDPDELAFDVDEAGFDDVLGRAKRLGAFQRGPVQHTDWSKGFYATDPDGRRLEFTCDDQSVYGLRGPQTTIAESQAPSLLLRRRSGRVAPAAGLVLDLVEAEAAPSVASAATFNIAAALGAGQLEAEAEVPSSRRTTWPVVREKREARRGSGSGGGASGS